MKTKSVLIFLILVCFSIIELKSQDFSTVNIYYVKKLGKLDEAITFNKTIIATMNLGSRLQCKIYSEGRINIISNNNLNGQDNLYINVEKNKTYYIEMTYKGYGNAFIGKLRQVEEDEGKKMFESNTKWQLKEFEEDINDPIIVKKNQ